MATPNKFSNPDTPAGDCLCAYLSCFAEPIRACICLPFVCCAWRYKNKHANDRYFDDTEQPENNAAGPPGIEIDASLPRSQWGVKKMEETQQEDGGGSIGSSPVPGASIERDVTRKGGDGEDKGECKERDDSKEERKDEKIEGEKKNKKPRKERLADTVLTAATGGY